MSRYTELEKRVEKLEHQICEFSPKTGGHDYKLHHECEPGWKQVYCSTGVSTHASDGTEWVPGYSIHICRRCGHVVSLPYGQKPQEPRTLAATTEECP